MRTVREIAMMLIERNPGYYGEDLLDLVPEELLAAELKDGNLHTIGILVDKLRFEKEAEFPGREEDPERLAELLNSPIGELSRDQEAKRREIRFLNNLVGAIINQ